MTFRYLNEVSDLFDVGVITDFSDSDRTIYALGKRADYAAGLRRFEITPYFDTLEKLEQFCGKHIERFRAIAVDPDVVPDASNWEDA